MVVEVDDGADRAARIQAWRTRLGFGLFFWIGFGFLLTVAAGVAVASDSFSFTMVAIAAICCGSCHCAMVALQCGQWSGLGGRWVGEPDKKVNSRRGPLDSEYPSHLNPCAALNVCCLAILFGAALLAVRSGGEAACDLVVAGCLFSL